MMRKNKSSTKINSKVNKQNLINKISDAMSMKYHNFFLAANYDNQTLKNDIDKLLNTQYYSKDPRDIFKPIETNILDIVKQKNPNLQVKIKKARKLPEIKYTKDKYQEADEPDIEKIKEKEKEKEKEKKILSSKEPKRTLPHTKNNLSKNKKSKSNSNLNIKKNKEKTLDIINNNDNKNNEPIIDVYKIPEEYGTKHTLLDKLKNRIKYDPTIKYLEEEQKLYEKEQEEKKKRKILEQKNYLNDLKLQIEQKGKKKEEERQNKLKDLEDIKQQIIIEKEQLNQKRLNDKIKRDKLKENYEKLIQEKDNQKKIKKQEEDKENKIFFELLKEQMNKEKQNIIDKKNKIKQEILKTQEINEKLSKEKHKQNDRINNTEGNMESQQQGLFRQNSLTNNVIKDRINKRKKEQEAAGNYLQKIYNSLEKQNNDIYLAEREKQEKRKKLEYEMADKNRQKKIEDYKKSLLDTLNYKNIEKQKKKEEDEKYRKDLEKEYAMYLKEENEKKLKKFEKFENYRKALEEQIKDNKIREFERLKNQ